MNLIGHDKRAGLIGRPLASVPLVVQTRNAGGLRNVCLNIGCCNMERGTRTGKRTAGGLTERRSKKGKNSDGTSKNTTPPNQKKVVSVRGLRAYSGGEPAYSQYLTSVYLRMDWWAIELQNRMRSGFLLGVNVYSADEEEDYNEVQFHLGIISVNFLWS